ncbi:hypothetical protein AB1Y20_014133 [Prymnesium parvum]|uniref:RING-type E3 ubiquitin transferase n=1 Tax=Prymnesium parvum TaxID=97485 RepID=A0AB34IH23_PRYPA
MDPSTSKAEPPKRASSDERKERKRSRRASPPAASLPPLLPPAEPAPLDAPLRAPPHAEPPAEPSFPTEESLPHLCCSVCLSFPEAEVLQCHSGHLLCRDCHDRVCIEQKPTCPTCRTPIDALKPVRNMALEQTLALLPTRCPNAPCAARLTRGGLSRHVESECPLRRRACKYAPLGCKWRGVAAEFCAHVDGCKRAEQPGWKLLKKVSDAAQETARKHEASLADALRYRKVVDALSSRCKNVNILHLTLHRCSSSEHVAGRPAHLMTATFHAVGCRFKLYTVNESSAQRYLAVLRLCDSRLPLPVDLFLLGAPGSPAIPLAPVTHRHTFAAARAKATEPLLLAEGSAADALGEAETLQLRLGVVDRRSGRLSGGFQGQAARWGGAEEGEAPWDSEAFDEASVVSDEPLDSMSHSDEADSDEGLQLSRRQRNQLAGGMGWSPMYSRYDHY